MSRELVVMKSGYQQLAGSIIEITTEDCKVFADEHEFKIRWKADELEVIAEVSEGIWKRLLTGETILPERLQEYA